MQLNLGSDEEPVVKKKSNSRNLKIALGLAAVILIPTLGSTLAGTITVGTAGAIEFGQGVITTAACDTAITVVPTSVLLAGTFNLDTITVSSVASTCSDKYFTIKVLSGNTPQVIGSASATFCKIHFKLASPYTATGDVGDTCGTISGATATGFSLTPTATLAASLVDKITLESSTT